MHLHVLAVIEFDPSTMPGGYSFDRIKDMIRSRLHLAPPLHRRLARVPFNLNHPVWIEDPDFDLDYHVHRIGCPAPGGPEELAELAGDIAGRQVDRDRPLWELWVVEGLANGRAAAIAKMHHATIDGVSGANLMVHFFDLEPEGTPRPGPEEVLKPERVPSDVELAVRGVAERVTRPVQAARLAWETVQSATRFVRTRMRLDGPGMAAPLTAPRTIYNGAITPHRQVAFAQLPLADVKAVKNAQATSVNDVVLAIASGAIRRHLTRYGEVPEKSMLASVPVSVRDEKDETRGSNKVSVMFSTLATDLADPVARLQAIHEANKGAKEEHHAIGASLLQNWAEFAAPTTFSMAARVYSDMRLAERHPVIHNLVISNVPGPPIPLYFAGARLTSMYPLGPVMHGAALNITVVSYRDTLYWGLIACPESVPGLWDLAAAIPEALEELRNPPTRRRAGPKRRPARTAVPSKGPAAKAAAARAAREAG